MTTPEEILAQAELELAEATYGLPEVDRRRFMLSSLATAAATTFGWASVARASGHPLPDLIQQQPATPPVPLGQGEAPALQFQPYPGGTGAAFEALMKERGAAAFERKVFQVEKWSGAVPTSPDDLAFLPAHRLSALLRARKITSLQLTNLYLERLERYNPTLNFAVTIMAESARAEATRADAEIAAGKWRGPLHGLPYGVKDLFSTRGVPTTWGTKDFDGRIIDEDADVVVRLREAGAVLLAKLATGQFAQGDQWHRGRTNNPWNPNQGASGSSAGPGSATAAGCCAFAIGTETSGSIVSPSIRNGISALRPTFGRVSRYGGMVLAWSMDRVGPMCRTVEDCAMVFSVIHGVDTKDPSTITMPFQFDRRVRLGSLRIGVDPQAPKEFIEKLRALGMQPREVGPRPTVAGAGSALGVEGAAAFDEYVQRKAKESGLDLANLPAPRVGGGGGGGGGGGAPAGGAPTTPPNPLAGSDWNPRFVNGRTPRAYDFIQGQRRRYILIQKWGEYMKDLDMFIGGPSADVGVNAQTGHPCVVVPYKFDVPMQGGPGGGGGQNQPRLELKAQPICATIIGGLYNDDRILSVAHAFQVATDIHLKHPAL
ncbi:MAG: amidase [Gemmatimonadetes bacterium]|nr:amidase [Gemmatimonadota bacterium]